MRCPSCSHPEDKVIESRPARDGAAIRRRRECLKCGARFTTYEEILREELRVIKHDGSVEEFSRRKLVDGISTACRKRPVSIDQIETLVDALIDQIGKNYEREVPSSVIGEWVMTALRSIDQVAFVRFASIFRRYADVQQFVSEIQNMKQPE